MRAVLVADELDRDSGLLDDFLREASVETSFVDRGALPETLVAPDVLVLLGSNRSAHDAGNATAVAAEVELIRRSLANGVPVLGICYGAQVLARALGGTSRRGAMPECGWTRVFSQEEALCPSGFWGQMHHDVIVPAASSRVIGWSPAGPQAFVDDSRGTRALGWQFHPEMTLAILERWLGRRYSGSELADGESTVAASAAHAVASAAVAPDLFREAFGYLRVPGFEQVPA